jgi:hypothetical protein
MLFGITVPTFAWENLDDATVATIKQFGSQIECRSRLSSSAARETSRCLSPNLARYHSIRETSAWREKRIFALSCSRS